LKAGCSIFPINCNKTHFAWNPKMYCGECITVRHKVLELEFFVQYEESSTIL
jgi:hypothetical protein